MDVPGPCFECHRVAVLEGCPLCGAQICGECRATGRHRCAKGDGPESPPVVS